MKRSGYSFLDRYLHRVFLGDGKLSHYFFERLLSKNSYLPETSKIFITGLARSGTTALLNNLFSLGNTASLQYENMPFVLNPRISQYFAKNSKISKTEIISQERLHGDGLKISLQSPECLDEPFWIKEDKNYFKKALDSSRIYSNSILKAYKKFIDDHAAFKGKDTMLIKNNNNHIRIKQLSKFFDSDLFIVLLRDPLSQAISLNNTHIKICYEQKKNPFILEYMNFLGHREFGLNQISFKYEDYPFLKLDEFELNLNYWIKCWINAYSFIHEFLNKDKPENVLILTYEELCNSKSRKLCNFLKKLHIDIDNKLSFINKNKFYSGVDYDQSLLIEAKNLYNELKLQSYL